MTRIESHLIHLDSSAPEVYAFLAELSNHERILPEQVINWKVDGDTCEYTIKGTGSVHLKVKERTENKSITLEPNGRIPFPFEVNWSIEAGQEGGCSVRAVMNAELNPVLKLMATQPLTNFLKMQVDNLKRVFDGKNARA